VNSHGQGDDTESHDEQHKPCLEESSLENVHEAIIVRITTQAMRAEPVFSNSHFNDRVDCFTARSIMFTTTKEISR
jgi:hypothetical protein